MSVARAGSAWLLPTKREMYSIPMHSNQFNNLAILQETKIFSVAFSRTCLHNVRTEIQCTLPIMLVICRR